LGLGSAPHHFFPLSSTNIREARLGRDDEGGIIQLQALLAWLKR